MSGAAEASQGHRGGALRRDRRAPGQARPPSPRRLRRLRPPPRRPGTRRTSARVTLVVETVRLREKSVKDRDALKELHESETKKLSAAHAKEMDNAANVHARRHRGSQGGAREGRDGPRRGTRRATGRRRQGQGLPPRAASKVARELEEELVRVKAELAKVQAELASQVSDFEKTSASLL